MRATRRFSLAPVRGSTAGGLGPRLILAVLAAAALPTALRAQDDSPERSVPTTETDLVTYIGWRVFGRYCASCHGRDAEGSSFAPSLVRRVGRLDRRRFYALLDEGYMGRFAPMRPWGEHPQVSRYYDELWAYLSARASGELPAGQLEPAR